MRTLLRAVTAAAAAFLRELTGVSQEAPAASAPRLSHLDHLQAAADLANAAGFDTCVFAISDSDSGEVEVILDGRGDGVMKAVGATVRSVLAGSDDRHRVSRVRISACVDGDPIIVALTYEGEPAEEGDD